MCHTCNQTPCSCSVAPRKKNFFISNNAIGQVQPVNPDFVITFEKFEDTRLMDTRGRFQIMFSVPDGMSKVQRIIWMFPGMSQRDLAFDNLKNETCLSV